MKTLLLALAITGCVATGVSAQSKTEHKVKKTTTLPQKVHNVFSKHKHYSGTKVKTIRKK